VAPRQRQPAGFGYPELWVFPEQGPPRCVGRARNTWTFAWGDIVARAAFLGQSEYVVKAAYLEYNNGASPDDPVTPPTINRAEQIDYFDGLAGIADRDFVRVPIGIPGELAIEPGTEGDLAEGLHNRLVVTVNAPSGTGVHGSSFSDTVNSRVYGAALVAAPVWDDRTQDIVFARAYFPEDQQAPMVPNSQVGISYPLFFP